MNLIINKKQNKTKETKSKHIPNPFFFGIFSFYTTTTFFFSRETK